MKRVLKNTGSIYLHCDPTASHYLKLVMDHVFGRKNFRNEIIWCYKSGGASPKRYFSKKHDIILWHTKSSQYQYNPQTEKSYNRGLKPYRFAGVKEYQDDVGWYTIVGVKDYWQIDMVGRTSKERLGYPTQKPLALLERIINASCPPEGVVLDPFCGCGTTVHAAEKLRRRWVGIDISTFASGLIKERLSKEFPHIRSEIEVRGTPETILDARALAQRDKFEFEKWVCGRIGAVGMYHNPGTPGADGGVDGLLKFNYIRPDEKLGFEYAIVQVKGGKVTSDSVRALRETVDRFGVLAGIMVCFDQYMTTVKNQRSRDTFQDRFGTYPVIQGYSVESLLMNEPLNLPLYGARRQGARFTF